MSKATSDGGLDARNSGFRALLDAAVAASYVADARTGVSRRQLLDRVREELPDRADCFVFMTGGAYTEEAKSFAKKHARRCFEKPLRRSAREARRKNRQLMHDVINAYGHFRGTALNAVAPSGSRA